MAEEWRPVVDYLGYYEVSDHGQVRSLDRIVINPFAGPTQHRGRILKIATDEIGRGRVGLSKEGVVRQRFVAPLVLEAFVGPRPTGFLACHNDGDPGRNVVSNLRWDSSAANTADRIRHGRDGNATKTVCPRGHTLFPPNLVNKPSRRACLACARTHRWAQTRGVSRSDPSWKAMSDLKYAEILRAA